MTTTPETFTLAALTPAERDLCDRLAAAISNASRTEIRAAMDADEDFTMKRRRELRQQVNALNARGSQ